MKRYSNISNNEKEELLNEFCEAISTLKNSDEIMDFLVDLLSAQEVVMLAKRIKVAKLLLKEVKYKDIEDSLKISSVTIAKIASWLEESGEGFRVINERSKKTASDNNKNTSIEKSDWDRLKNRYPIMFWPENLTKEVFNNMNKKEKQKLKNSLEKLNKKSKQYSQVSKFFK